MWDDPETPFTATLKGNPMYHLSVQRSPRLLGEVSWSIMRNETATWEGWTVRTLGVVWFIERRKRQAL